MSSAVTTDFEVNTQEVLLDLRSSLSAIISRIPGEIRTAADLERALGIGKTLAWQVLKIARSDDLLGESVKMPGPFAMKRFLEAAAATGVPADRIDSVSKRIDEFNGLVTTHAGDRSTFRSLISSVTGDKTDQIDLQQRRVLFRANSHVWGVQARTRFNSSIHYPGKTPDVIDVASLRGFFALRRLRAGIPFMLSRVMLPCQEPGKDSPQPIDTGRGNRARLLRRFCSQPIPKILIRRDGDFDVATLPAGAIGNAGASDYVFGDVIRGLLWDNPLEPRNVLIGSANRVPVESFVQDVLVYDGMYGPIEPDVNNYGDLSMGWQGRNARSWREQDRLPIRFSVISAGRGPSALDCADVPRYPEIIEYACKRLGWDAGKFDVYRCRVEYPLLHSFQIIRIDLPDKLHL